MILTNNRKTIVLFGVSPDEKGQPILRCGLSYWEANCPNIIELFDESGQSWGTYNTHQQSRDIFNIKTKSICISKA
jgi:hypothetical protein